VNSDKQTLILAGEAIPRRDAVSSSSGDLALSHLGPRLTIVATRADNTMLLAHGDTSSPSMALSTGGQNKLHRSGYVSSARGFSFNAANEYARTQDFSGAGTRSTTIDTYA
jgi:hypothetical protein